MNGLINVFKPISYTPLQIVHALRKNLAVEKNVKIGYAGRLDPLASGVLLLMVGDECKNRDSIQGLTKSYQFSILFGIRTDSLDPLGKIVRENFDYSIDSQELDKVLYQFTGNIELKYPLYSSFAIDGVPMHKLARAGVLQTEDRPSKIVEIKSIKLLDLKLISISILSKKFIEEIKNVNGHFDQKNVITWWKSYSNNNQEVQVATIEVEASSGTYVRSLAELIGDMLKIPTIAYDIERHKVGNFNINNSLKVFNT